MKEKVLFKILFISLFFIILINRKFNFLNFRNILDLSGVIKGMTDGVARN